MKILLKNISSLYRVAEKNAPAKTGSDLADALLMKDAWLLVSEGKIDSIGQGTLPSGADEVVDCRGRIVFPGFVDSHTHLIFARSREEEFVDKIHGLSYEEIAARGGGILNSARRLQEASDEQLLESALGRIAEIRATGTTTVEIKSGYGLTVKDELRMLRLGKKIGELGGITVKTTLLGAHAVPVEYKGRKEAWVDVVVNELIPAAASEKLADHVDVFCEANYFSVEDTLRIMEAGLQNGLPSKIHVNQFNAMGGIEAAISKHAISVDHLEVCTDADIVALSKSETIACLLPGCSFYLGLPYAPVRKLIEAGGKICLATDFNPGSAPSGSMPFMMALACIRMKLLPDEALVALTHNAAHSLRLADRKGSLNPGMDADLILTHSMENLAQIPYFHSRNPVARVMVAGKWN